MCPTMPWAPNGTRFRCSWGPNPGRKPAFDTLEDYTRSELTECMERGPRRCTPYTMNNVPESTDGAGRSHTSLPIFRSSRLATTQREARHTTDTGRHGQAPYGTPRRSPQLLWAEALGVWCWPRRIDGRGLKRACRLERCIMSNSNSANRTSNTQETVWSYPYSLPHVRWTVWTGSLLLLRSTFVCV